MHSATSACFVCCADYASVRPRREVAVTWKAMHNVPALCRPPTTQLCFVERALDSRTARHRLRSRYRPGNTSVDSPLELLLPCSLVMTARSF